MTSSNKYTSVIIVVVCCLSVKPVYNLLWLNQADSTSISLINNTNIFRFFITEDIEVMINVIKSKDGFLNRHGITQIKTKRMCGSVKENECRSWIKSYNHTTSQSNSTYFFTFVTTACSGSINCASSSGSSSTSSIEFKTSARFSPIFGPPW